jgi:hypothetical protein
MNQNWGVGIIHDKIGKSVLFICGETGNCAWFIHVKVGNGTQPVCHEICNIIHT